MELYFSDAVDRRAALSKDAVDMARRLGDSDTLATALFSRHMALWDPDNSDERLAVANETVQLAARTSNRELALQGYRWRMPDLLELGEVSAAWRDLEAHAQLARELRQPFYLWDATRWRATRAIVEGRYAEAEQLAEQASEFGERVLSGTARQYRVWHLFDIRREQGRLGELEAAVDDGVSRYPTWRCWRAQLYLESGRQSEARREFEALAANDFEGVSFDLGWLCAACILAEVCTGLGDVARADTLYRLLTPYEARLGVPGSAATCCGSVSRYLGLLATLLCRWDVANQHFVNALEANERLAARPLIAHTQMDYARMLRVRGHSTDLARVSELVGKALDTAEQLGMSRLANEGREFQQVAAADSRTRRDAHSHPRPAGLSDREVEVLRLVAAGRTNREIGQALSVSPNTVLRHVTNILAKTGASNRAEAATYGVRNGLVDLT